MGKFIVGMVVGGTAGAAVGFYGCFRLLIRSENIRNGFKNAVCDSVERMFFGVTRDEQRNMNKYKYNYYSDYYTEKKGKPRYADLFGT